MAIFSVSIKSLNRLSIQCIGTIVYIYGTMVPINFYIMISPSRKQQSVYVDGNLNNY